MRIFHNKTYIYFLIIIPIIFGACKKAKESKIVGVWKVETYSLRPDPLPGYWIFEGSGNVTIVNDNPSHTQLDTAKGEYRIVMKSLVLPHLELNQPLEYSGLWRIEKLNSDILVIARIAFLDKNNKTHAYLRREFTRVKNIGE